VHKKDGLSGGGNKVIKSCRGILGKKQGFCFHILTNILIIIIIWKGPKYPSFDLDFNGVT